MSDPLEIVDLIRPHGFLVWRGKQQAIASPTPLPTGEVMITSDGEAFGVAMLGQPSQMNLSEFERQADKHCIRPEERKIYYPTADSFYVYTIKSWQGFSEPQPITDYQPTPEEAALIEKGKRLPKTIIIQPDAITLTDSGFVAIEEIKSPELSTTLQAIFESVEYEGEKELPLYSLALVRRPTLRWQDIKKKEISMPYEINDNDCVINSETGKVEKCHDTHEEATAHLAALNINVEDAKESDDSQGEKRSLQEMGQVQERFLAEFCRHDYGDYRENPWPIDIIEDAVITNWQGGLYRVPFTQDNGKITFASRFDWQPVAVNYVSTGIAQKAITKAETSKAGRRLKDAMMEKLRTAKEMIDSLMTWGGYSDLEEISEVEEEAMLDMLKGASGFAIKMVNGEPWHVSWSSNSFEDRDGEIFSIKALEQYVLENAENEVKGWFNLWHIPGTDYAEKRYQVVIDKFLFEAGPYLKDFKGKKALEFFKKYPDNHPEIAPEGWGSSVEYRYLPEERKNKVYEWVWITRTSTLARGAAANIWTKSAQQEFVMTEEQKIAGIALFGEEYMKNLIGQGKQKTEQLEEAGVANKDKAPEGESTPEQPEGEAGIKTSGEPTTAPDTSQVLEALATKMMTNIAEAFVPVLNELQGQVVSLGEQVTNLSSELKALKGEQVIKQQVELPRFTFDMIRASQAKETTVPEGDALKDKKPQEVNSGSLTQAYFPGRK